MLYILGLVFVLVGGWKLLTSWTLGWATNLSDVISGILVVVGLILMFKGLPS